MFKSTPWDCDDTMSDEDLLALARQGSGDAFGALYSRHAGGARRYAAYLSRQILRRDCSDDVTAEAVRKTFSAIQRGHGPAISFRQYLRTAIRSVAMEMSTAAHREVRLDDVPDQEAPAADDSLDAVLGMQAFRSLPPRWQQALWTDAVEQIPPREVAPMLGTTPSSVAVTTFRAREAFRIAYVRAHMPYAANDRCRVALDLIARGEVVELSDRQQRVLAAHLESCCGCRHAQVSIDDATNGWSDEGWSPNDSDRGDELAVGASEGSASATQSHSPAPFVA